MDSVAIREPISTALMVKLGIQLLKVLIPYHYIYSKTIFCHFQKSEITLFFRAQLVLLMPILIK